MESLLRPDHEYLCRVTNVEDPMLRKQAVTINGNRIEIPMGVDTRVRGVYLMCLESKGRYRPSEPIVDKDTGQQSSGPSAWVPRFAITVLSDLTAKMAINAPPVPSGAVLLDNAGKQTFTRSELTEKGLFQLQKLCAERKILYSKNDPKDVLVSKLLGDDSDSAE
jgi:hypothetical protein